MPKLYRFYQIPSNEALVNSDDLKIEEKYPLYAFTIDKDIRDEFVATRNVKDNFIERKSKISKEDYKKFGNANNGCRLDRFSFQHYANYYKDKECKYVKVVTTWNEKEIVQACLDDGLSEINESISYSFLPFIFKEKYIKALSVLEYISFWKMHGRPEQFIGFLTESEQEESMDYSYPNVSYDELNKFIDLYGKTFL